MCTFSSDKSSVHSKHKKTEEKKKQWEKFAVIRKSQLPFRLYGLKERELDFVLHPIQKSNSNGKRNWREDK